VLGLYCRQYRKLLALEKRLRQHGVDVYEADVRPPERYLMERFITAPVLFAGTPPEDAQLLLEGQLKPGGATARPPHRVAGHRDHHAGRAALDRAGRLRPAPGVHAGAAEWRPVRRSTSRSNTATPGLALLERLEAWFQAHDPDAVIGWSVVQFDLRVLQKHAEQLGGRCAWAATAARWNGANAPAASITSAGSPAAWSSTASRRCARPPGAFPPSAWSRWRKPCWARARTSTIPTTAWPRSTACSTRTSRRWRATT
jgi:hypothetical protein